MTTERPQIGTEIATTRDGYDVTRGFIGPVLGAEDSVLRLRGDARMQIYRDVLSDPRVGSTLRQRRLALVGTNWRVEPGDDRRVSRRAAEHLEAQLLRVGWDRVTDRMHYGVFYGYAVSELIYGVRDGLISIEAIRVRNRSRFRFDQDQQLRLLTPQQPLAGIAAPAPYFWHMATGADHDDEPYGLGLAHWCYWPVFFKRHGIRYWLTFLEKFGSPTAIGEFEPGTSDGDKAKLLEAVQALQQDSGIIIPKGMVVRLLEAARSGAADYEALKNAMDREIAIIVVGQTMTTEDGSSLSQAKVHQAVAGDLIQADSDLINESFNRGPATWLAEWNFPGAAPPRVVRETQPEEDLTARCERDSKIVSMGFKPSLQYVHEQYGGEWSEKTPAAAGALPPSAALAPAGAELADPADGHGVADPVHERLVTVGGLEAQAVIAGWVERARAVIDGAQSFAEMEAGLLALYDQLPAGELGEVVAQALTASHLHGMDVVKTAAADDA